MKIVVKAFYTKTITWNTTQHNTTHVCKAQNFNYLLCKMHVQTSLCFYIMLNIVLYYFIYVMLPFSFSLVSVFHFYRSHLLDICFYLFFFALTHLARFGIWSSNTHILSIWACVSVCVWKSAPFFSSEQKYTFIIKIFY